MSKFDPKDELFWQRLHREVDAAIAKWEPRWRAARAREQAQEEAAREAQEWAEVLKARRQRLDASGARVIALPVKAKRRRARSLARPCRLRGSC